MFQENVAAFLMGKKDDIIVGDGFKHALFLPLLAWGND